MMSIPSLRSLLKMDNAEYAMMLGVPPPPDPPQEQHEEAGSHPGEEKDEPEQQATRGKPGRLRNRKPRAAVISLEGLALGLGMGTPSLESELQKSWGEIAGKIGFILTSADRVIPMSESRRLDQALGQKDGRRLSFESEQLIEDRAAAKKDVTRLFNKLQLIKTNKNLNAVIQHRMGKAAYAVDDDITFLDRDLTGRDAQNPGNDVAIAALLEHLRMQTVLCFDNIGNRLSLTRLLRKIQRIPKAKKTKRHLHNLTAAKTRSEEEVNAIIQPVPEDEQPVQSEKLAAENSPGEKHGIAKHTDLTTEKAVMIEIKRTMIKIKRRGKSQQHWLEQPKMVLRRIENTSRTLKMQLDMKTRDVFYCRKKIVEIDKRWKTARTTKEPTLVDWEIKVQELRMNLAQKVVLRAFRSKGHMHSKWRMEMSRYRAAQVRLKDNFAEALKNWRADGGGLDNGVTPNPYKHCLSFTPAAASQAFKVWREGQRGQQSGQAASAGGPDQVKSDEVPVINLDHALEVCQAFGVTREALIAREKKMDEPKRSLTNRWELLRNQVESYNRILREQLEFLLRCDFLGCPLRRLREITGHIQTALDNAYTSLTAAWDNARTDLSLPSMQAAKKKRAKGGPESKSLKGRFDKTASDMRMYDTLKEIALQCEKELTFLASLFEDHGAFNELMRTQKQLQEIYELKPYKFEDIKVRGEAKETNQASQASQGDPKFNDRPQEESNVSTVRISVERLQAALEAPAKAAQVLARQLHLTWVTFRVKWEVLIPKARNAQQNFFDYVESQNVARRQKLLADMKKKPELQEQLFAKVRAQRTATENAFKNDHIGPLERRLAELQKQTAETALELKQKKKKHADLLRELMTARKVSAELSEKAAKRAEAEQIIKASVQADGDMDPEGKLESHWLQGSTYLSWIERVWDSLAKADPGCAQMLLTTVPGLAEAIGTREAPVPDADSDSDKEAAAEAERKKHFPKLEQQLAQIAEEEREVAENKRVEALASPKSKNRVVTNEEEFKRSKTQSPTLKKDGEMRLAENRALGEGSDHETKEADAPKQPDSPGTRDKSLKRSVTKKLGKANLLKKSGTQAAIKTQKSDPDDNVAEGEKEEVGEAEAEIVTRPRGLTFGGMSFIQKMRKQQELQDDLGELNISDPPAVVMETVRDTLAAAANSLEKPKPSFSRDMMSTSLKGKMRAVALLSQPKPPGNKHARRNALTSWQRLLIDDDDDHPQSENSPEGPLESGNDDQSAEGKGRRTLAQSGKGRSMVWSEIRDGVHARLDRIKEGDYDFFDVGENRQLSDDEDENETDEERAHKLMLQVVVGEHASSKDTISAIVAFSIKQTEKLREELAERLRQLLMQGEHCDWDSVKQLLHDNAKELKYFETMAKKSETTEILPSELLGRITRTRLLIRNQRERALRLNDLYKWKGPASDLSDGLVQKLRGDLAKTEARARALEMCLQDLTKASSDDSQCNKGSDADADRQDLTKAPSDDSQCNKGGDADADRQDLTKAPSDDSHCNKGSDADADRQDHAKASSGDSDCNKGSDGDADRQDLAKASSGNADEDGSKQETFAKPTELEDDRGGEADTFIVEAVAALSQELYDMWDEAVAGRRNRSEARNQRMSVLEFESRAQESGKSILSTEEKLALTLAREEKEKKDKELKEILLQEKNNRQMAKEFDEKLKQSKQQKLRAQLLEGLNQPAVAPKQANSHCSIAAKRALQMKQEEEIQRKPWWIADAENGTSNHAGVPAEQEVKWIYRAMTPLLRARDRRVKRIMIGFKVGEEENLAGRGNKRDKGRRDERKGGCYFSADDAFAQEVLNQKRQQRIERKYIFGRKGLLETGGTTDPHTFFDHLGEESLGAKYEKTENDILNLHEFQSVAEELQRTYRGLPPATAADLQDVFTEIDSKKIGAIRFTDLHRAKKLLLTRRSHSNQEAIRNQHIPPEVLEALGTKHNKKFDDRITLAEVHAFSSELLQMQGLAPASLPDVSAAFNLLDSDKRGSISFVEVDKVCRLLQQCKKQRLCKAGVIADADSSWRAILVPNGFPAWKVGTNTGGKSGGKSLQRRGALKALLARSEQERGKLPGNYRGDLRAFHKSFHGPRLSIFNRQPDLEFMKANDTRSRGRIRYLLHDEDLQDDEGLRVSQAALVAQPISKRRLVPACDEGPATEQPPEQIHCHREAHGEAHATEKPTEKPQRSRMPNYNEDAATEQSPEQVHPSPQLTPTASASSSLQELSVDKEVENAAAGKLEQAPESLRVTLLSHDVLLSSLWHKITGLQAGSVDATPDEAVKSPTPQFRLLSVAGVREAAAVELPPLQGTKVEILPPRPATVMGTVSTVARNSKTSGWLPRAGCESTEGASCRDYADSFGCGRGISSCATTARRSSCADTIAGRDVASSASSYEVWMKTTLDEVSEAPPRPHTSCSAVHPKHSWTNTFGSQHTPRSHLRTATKMESDSRKPESRPHPRSSKVVKKLSPMQAYEKDWDWSALDSFLESMNSEDLPDPELDESRRRSLVVSPFESAMKQRPHSEMGFASTRLAQAHMGRPVIQAPERLRARSVQGNADQFAEPFPVQTGRPLTLSDASKKTPATTRPSSWASASPLSATSPPASASPTKPSREKATSKAFHTRSRRCIAGKSRGMKTRESVPNLTTSSHHRRTRYAAWH
eukprot:TRINITY_DN25511_c0_g1_i2.p1 TRINITY_DN25511_c0_g1~~TRINITY_DN25511_c0_g1_i2.p1  ORF type:complete len:2920 (-),score=585.79 TRINITY_DN25511_c0_g1_i2:359-8347(-)